MHMRRRTMLLVLASCAAEQLSVHISPFMSAGSTQPICSGGPDCRQALTATFSLAMISLGEDFGAGALPAALEPDDATLCELAAYYRPHNERLFALLGRDLGWHDDPKYWYYRPAGIQRVKP